MMKTKVFPLLLCIIIGQSFAFLTPNSAAGAAVVVASSASSSSTFPAATARSSSTITLAARDGLDDFSLNEPSNRKYDEAAFVKIVSGDKGFGAMSIMAGLATGLCSFVSRGMAASDEYEMAELPPPYVPAIFAVVLLAGVGLLTGSLGDVLDEEASLGLQSGARAKKEIERSRSSYFKK